MKTTRTPVRFASGTLDKHRHICAFVNSRDEEHRVLRSFITEGINAGEKAFHIVDPAQCSDHMKRLEAGGVDVSRTIATGQLEVCPWHEAHLRGDYFNQDAMLALVEEVLQANARVYPLTRIVAHMEWALLDKPGVDDLIEYEARVNYLLPRYDDIAICVYDLSKFSASVVLNVLRTHPMVIIGGVLQENPYFMPPDLFLAELRRRPQRSTITAASIQN